MFLRGYGLPHDHYLRELARESRQVKRDQGTLTGDPLFCDFVVIVCSSISLALLALSLYQGFSASGSINKSLLLLSTAAGFAVLAQWHHDHSKRFVETVEKAREYLLVDHWNLAQMSKDAMVKQALQCVTNSAKSVLIFQAAWHESSLPKDPLADPAKFVKAWLKASLDFFHSDVSLIDSTDHTPHFQRAQAMLNEEKKVKVGG